MAAATARIEELDRERRQREADLHQLQQNRLDHVERADVEAALSSMPDLRAVLAEATPAELAEIFDAFEITAYYDKRDHTLDVTAVVIPELWRDEARETEQPATRAGRRTLSIAGAGFEPATSGL